MPSTKNTLALIDKYIEQNQKSGFRNHLGASIIGRKCSRNIWYTFRWAKDVRFKARMVRLFDRGNLEETRFEKWFREAGIEVYTKHPNGEQFRISDLFGHFGGSLDGMGCGIPDIPTQPFVFEFKTYKDNLFKQLIKDKVKKHKFEHYVQMQIYMFKQKLKWALYCAINKNDDHIHLELVRNEPEVAKEHMAKAERIIFTDEPPARINASPAWHECRMCSYHTICHYYELPSINCRTCAHSTPLKKEYGAWDCQIRERLPASPEKGCEQHLFSPYILNGVDYGECNLDENWINLQMPNGITIKHGPHHISSAALAKHYTRNS